MEINVRVDVMSSACSVCVCVFGQSVYLIELKSVGAVVGMENGATDFGRSVLLGADGHVKIKNTKQ